MSASVLFASGKNSFLTSSLLDKQEALQKVNRKEFSRWGFMQIPKVLLYVGLALAFEGDN